MRNLLFSLALFVSIFSTAPTVQAAVWETEQEWSPAWEDRYAEWIRLNWNKDFFARPGTAYTGLKLDCADVVYSMRIIFAYEHRLPFAMKDPTGGSKLITNSMARFDALGSPEKRIRAFLNFIFGISSTQSLPNDTVPLALSRDSIRSGSLILTDRKSHHSWTIRELQPTGLPSLIFSSRPPKTTLQVREGQPSLEFTFHGRPDLAPYGGFRGFRRIEDLSKPDWQSHGFSDEQFRIPPREWMQTVKKRLALSEESPDALLTRTLENACIGARERIEFINEGVAYLRGLGSERCLSATEYDNYSTPNRDMRLRNSFEELRDAVQALEGATNVSPELKATAEDVVKDAGSSRPAAARTCPVEIAPGRLLPLAEIYRRSLHNELSDNPHDPFAQRWGEQTGSSSRAKRCPKHE
ncbi:MAG: hypothetical protein NDJ89_16095 [Oligoflexia bacterium]|nr:hypothetical protein [Oligoflexia bacterium]